MGKSYKWGKVTYGKILKIGLNLLVSQSWNLVEHALLENWLKIGFKNWLKVIWGEYLKVDWKLLLLKLVEYWVEYKLEMAV